eukprot:TRINITY_DN25622_c0_g1_i1.p1 TRINITY_DN25622_c0_g1~~TRINITY_DN25622_c0_g1_i1.p1  ORF type:complete len:546 (-),score=167.33 TRINITY_DN25622_c0_g1_i1:66-1703(-)
MTTVTPNMISQSVACWTAAPTSLPVASFSDDFAEAENPRRKRKVCALCPAESTYTTSGSWYKITPNKMMIVNTPIVLTVHKPQANECCAKCYMKNRRLWEKQSSHCAPSPSSPSQTTSPTEDAVGSPLIPKEQTEKSGSKELGSPTPISTPITTSTASTPTSTISTPSSSAFSPVSAPKQHTLPIPSSLTSLPNAPIFIKFPMMAPKKTPSPFAHSTPPSITASLPKQFQSVQTNAPQVANNPTTVTLPHELIQMLQNGKFAVSSMGKRDRPAPVASDIIEASPKSSKTEPAAHRHMLPFPLNNPQIADEEEDNFISNEKKRLEGTTRDSHALIFSIQNAITFCKEATSSLILQGLLSLLTSFHRQLSAITTKFEQLCKIRGQKDIGKSLYILMKKEYNSSVLEIQKQLVELNKACTEVSANPCMKDIFPMIAAKASELSAQSAQLQKKEKDTKGRTFFLLPSIHAVLKTNTQVSLDATKSDAPAPAAPQHPSVAPASAQTGKRSTGNPQESLPPIDSILTESAPKKETDQENRLRSLAEVACFE